MTFFSLFLGVQSAPEVGPTSYETPCIYIGRNIETRVAIVEIVDREYKKNWWRQPRRKKLTQFPLWNERNKFLSFSIMRALRVALFSPAARCIYNELLSKLSPSFKMLYLCSTSCILNVPGNIIFSPSCIYVRRPAYVLGRVKSNFVF